MTEFALPLLGFGDEQWSPTTVVWRDGTVLCRGYGGILGGWPEPEPQASDNVISFAQYKEKKRWVSESPSSPDEPRPGAA
jgi:hypothetical protein